MKLIGATRAGNTSFDMLADRMWLGRHIAPRDLRIIKLTALIDGLGAGSGDQAVRGVIYLAPGGALVASGAEVMIEDNQPPEWVDLGFPDWPTGVPIARGQRIDLGVQVGGPGSGSVRVYGESF